MYLLVEKNTDFTSALQSKNGLGSLEHIPCIHCMIIAIVEYITVWSHL